MQDQLPLRDIHLAAAPPWWPPAPGWWLVLAALAAVALAFAWWRAWQRRRVRAATQLFDDAIAAAPGGSARIAAMSELLRRASRRRNADADKLQGDDWLRFLDRGLKQPVFAAGAGRLLRDGGFRRDVSQAEADALQAVVRARFVDWMVHRK